MSVARATKHLRCDYVVTYIGTVSVPAASLEELEARVAGLERRLAALEVPGRWPGEHPGSPAQADRERFWALEGLRSRAGSCGAVLFAGLVDLPGAPKYEWQQSVHLRALVDKDWDDLADPLAALGHPVRLQLLHEVLSGHQTSSELVDTEGLGTSGQLYHHLRHLVAAGWLRSIGRGRYEVPPTRVIPLLVVLAAAQR
jgi:DNA-binding transcriptional ArsR family regulator